MPGRQLVHLQCGARAAQPRRLFGVCAAQLGAGRVLARPAQREGVPRLQRLLSRHQPGETVQSDVQGRLAQAQQACARHVQQGRTSGAQGE